MNDSLQPYLLPLKGLGDGAHEFTYQVDGDFFRAFPDAPVEESDVAMRVALDKRPNLLVLDFSFTGWVSATCDRCLVPIQLPIDGENRLLVKYGEGDDNGEEDVVYIAPETSKWSIAQYVYEYVLLALPLIKAYACEEEADPPCDFETLDRLRDDAETTHEDEDRANPFRDALKDWNKGASEEA